MKFPTATVILVSAAVLFVLWNQTREPAPPLDTTSFNNPASSPVDRSRVLDWVMDEVPRLCKEATGSGEGANDHAACLDAVETRESVCRRAMADQFPDTIGSEQMFRDVSVTMMDCLVQQSRLLGE
jgi:hypothetical protein